jgi:lysozyme
MKTSNIGIELIKEFESLHDGDSSLIGLQPKMCPAGVWTEGYGHAMRDSKGNFIKGKANKTLAYNNAKVKTKTEATKLLFQDLDPREYIVEQKVKVDLNQNQFDALVSYVYNTGGSSTLYNLINKKAPDADIKKWIETKYISADGVKLAGLVRRRKAESNLFFTPV